MQFTEIEHKFIVDEAFDLEAFERALAAIGPSRKVSLRVRDRYFLTRDGRQRRYILRHRHDRDLHELTLKTVEADAEVRGEINLALRPQDQDATVDAFVAAQGRLWQGTLWKDLTVWHFDDCEVVHYVATTENRRLICVEFEARHQATVSDALAVVDRYERATGFSGRPRATRSLLELMWPDALPEA